MIARQHLHHFSRGLVIGFEILGLFALVIFAGWLSLIIRLSQGPLQVDFLTANIEKALHHQQSDFDFTIGSTRLVWGGEGKPFELEIEHVQINRLDHTPVLVVEKIGVRLSKRHLVFGRIVPRAIRIYGLALHVVRGEDGHFTLNVANAETALETAPENKNPAVPAAPENKNPSPAAPDFITSLLANMNETGLRLLGGLEEVDITDAALLYEDKILHVAWKSKNSDVNFSEEEGDLVADCIANIEQGQTHKAYIRASLHYDWSTHKPNGVVYFTNFNPALAAQQSAQLEDFSGIDLPLRGSIAFEMDPDFNPGYGRFVLGADAGKLNAFDFYPAPLPVESLYMQGRFNVATRELQLQRMHADLGGPKLLATAEVQHQADGHHLTLHAVLEDMPLDRLKDYWPKKLTPDPRAWVTGHLSAGKAGRATVDLSMLAPQGDFTHPVLQQVGGQIDFTGVKVDYFSPLPPVIKVDGKAIYDQKSFHIDVNGGLLDDMRLGHGKVTITDLDIQNDKVHSQIEISTSLKGPLKTALQVLDSKPLRYPEKLGIVTAEVAGDADVDVDFKFPLYNKLATSDIRVTASAQLNKVSLKNIVPGLTLSGGPLAVTVEGGALKVKGKGNLGDMPITFQALRDFSAQAKTSSSLEAKLSLSAPVLEKFGVPAELKVAGMFPAEIAYTALADHSAKLHVQGDLAPLAFTLPGLDAEKLPGEAGKLDLSVYFRNGEIAQIIDLTLTAGANRLKGSVDFKSDGKSLKKAQFSQIKWGDTDIALDADSSSNEGYTVKISGHQFDATHFLTERDEKQNDTAAAQPVIPLTVSMAVDRLVTGKNKSLDALRLFMRENRWNRIEQLEVDGISGDKPLSLSYLPVAQGHTLDFNAENAGAALSAFGITDGVRGGALTVTGAPNPDGGKRDLQGKVLMTDFTLVNVPVLGRLLNGLSLTGILELLNGKGIAFKKMRSDFWWVDAGPPDSTKNIRLIRLKDGQTSGASLGLTFEGSIDTWSKTLDIGGTIIPVSGLNKMLSVIPLVGDILTGGGEGIFAATYTIKGPQDKPDVTVNPLAVLAPGILRKLFFGK